MWISFATTWTILHAVLYNTIESSKWVFVLLPEELQGITMFAASFILHSLSYNSPFTCYVMAIIIYLNLSCYIYCLLGNYNIALIK